MSVKVLEGFKVSHSCCGGVGSIGCNRSIDAPYSCDSGGPGGSLDDPLGAYPALLGQSKPIVIDLDGIKVGETGGGSTHAGTDWDGGVVPCGGQMGVSKCDHGHVKVHRYHCDRQMCPVCNKKWIAREASRIRERIAWVHKDYPSLKDIHIVVSYPDEPDGLEAYEDRLEEVYKILKKMHVLGGCVIPHRAVRANGVKEMHYHVEGVGYKGLSSEVKRVVVENYRKTGIVVKYIRKIVDHEKLSSYELDHAVHVVKNATGHAKQTVTWFGMLSVRSIGVQKSTRREPVMCDYKDKTGEVCGLPLYEQRTVWRWDNYEMYPVENPPLTRLIETRNYFWRKRSRKCKKGSE